MIRHRASSLQFLEELVQSWKFTCMIVLLRDYYSILNFFIELSRKSGQSTLSRSVLQGLLYFKLVLIFGTIPIKIFLWESVRSFNSPPILNPKHPLDTGRKLVFGQFLPLLHYSVHDFLYTCWYPYELLIGFIVFALTRTENNLLAQEEYADHQNKIQGSSNSAKNRKSKLKKHKKQQTPYRQESFFITTPCSACAVGCIKSWALSLMPGSHYGSFNDKPFFIF